MGELEKMGVYACALAMPDPNNPVPNEWVKEVARHVESNPRDQIYLVGHSLGVPAILRYVESTKVKNIKGIVLVSGPFFKTAKKKVAEFLKKPFNCKEIQTKVKHRVVIHGTDDKSVSPDQAVALAEELNARIIMIKNGGHLNGSSGWHTLPQCLKALKEMMK